MYYVYWKAGVDKLISPSPGMKQTDFLSEYKLYNRNPVDFEIIWYLCSNVNIHHSSVTHLDVITIGWTTYSESRPPAAIHTSAETR